MVKAGKVQFLAALLRLLIDFIQIARNGGRKVAEFEGQYGRIAQAKDSGSGVLRKSTAIGEIRVGEMRVPVQRIVNGVIDSPLALPSEAFVHAGDAKIVQEGDIVRTRAESANGEVLFGVRGLFFGVFGGRVVDGEIGKICARVRLWD